MSKELSYNKLFDTLLSSHQNKLHANLKRRKLNTMMNVMSENKAKGLVTKGWRRLMTIRRALDSFKPFERTKMQKRFHHAFLQATAMHLFRDDVDVDLARVMHQNNWDSLKQQCLCMTPRRFGKTMSVGMFCAAYLYSVENCEIAIFSTGRRASQKLLELINSLICKLPKGRERIVKYNQEVLNMSNYDESFGQSKLSSYPSNAKTLRGVGADIVIMEEAAFMDTKVFYEVIVPLLEVENTALICISTPQDSMNFYSEMFNMKLPNGEGLFNTLEVKLACDDCLKGDHPERCVHMTDEIPPWKSVAKFDMIKAIYGNKVELLQRESMGLVTEDMMSVFKQKYVEALYNSEKMKLTKEPAFVFIATDPNGGGSSDMAIVSLVIEYNKIIIVGMDSAPVKGHEQIEALLKSHIEGLRRQQKFREAWFVFIPENNLGHEADHMEFMLRPYRRVYTLTEKGGVIGVNTTAVRKELYSMETVKYLCQESIKFWTHLVVANPKGGSNEKERVLTDFKEQLLSFKRIIVHPDRGFSLPKIHYSGKSKGGRDDLIMSLMIGIYWTTEFVTKRTEAPYEQFKD